jgi:Ca-activated chloride channel family protein
MRRLRSGTALGAITAALILLVGSGCSAGSHSPNSGQPPVQQQGAPVPGAAPGNGAAPEMDSKDPNRTGFQPEIHASEQPNSTFAIDIDTASYNYARRQIKDGNYVDPSTVRPEEFINSFRQDYPQPAGAGFTVNTDGARSPGANEGYRILRVGLQTRAENPAERTSAALTFVVDVSGSMAEPGRLDLVQDALHYLIDQLRPTDKVAIVAYDDRARVLREMTPVSSRQALHAAVDALHPGGSTNLEAGLVTGYQVARGGFVEGATNRVILLSDGLANVGNTEAEPILRQIREEAAKQITLLGVGVGSEYGDALMEQLADEGDGFVTYVSEQAQARRLFVDRLPATLTLRALDAKVQVGFEPGAVDTYRLVGYDNRLLSDDDFRNNRVDGGEVGPGHSVTAIYMVRLKEGARGTVATARVRWSDPTNRRAQETAVSVTVADLDRGFNNASPRLRVDYAAGFFAEVLRHSPYGQNIRLNDLAAIADDAARQTDDDQAAELADLIRRAG